MANQNQYPIGHQPPGTQPGQGGQPQTYETPEPKRRADEASGREEPSANPKRAPEHEPGFEEKHKKEAQKGQRDRQDSPSMRSQADDAGAQNAAEDDLDAAKTQKANRTRPAASRQHVKRLAHKPKAKVRKHK